MLDLRHDVTAAADARAEATDAFARYGMPAELVQDGLLVVSELVANAVRHGGAPVRLDVTGEPGRVMIKVHDEAGGGPVRQRPNDDGGRGLHLVTALATNWGCARHEDGRGKYVWAELAW